MMSSMMRRMGIMTSVPLDDASNDDVGRTCVHDVDELIRVKMPVAGRRVGCTGKTDVPLPTF